MTETPSLERAQHLFAGVPPKQKVVPDPDNPHRLWRRVYLGERPLRPLTAAGVLRTGERHFSMLRSLGVAVPEHTYYQDINRRTLGRLATIYAHVDRIEGVDALELDPADTRRQQLEEALRAYYDQTADTHVRLSDNGKLRQYRFGQPSGEPSQEPGMYLLDIEPRLKSTDPFYGSYESWIHVLEPGRYGALVAAGVMPAWQVPAPRPHN